jgi:hypothetical protein
MIRMGSYTVLGLLLAGCDASADCWYCEDGAQETDLTAADDGSMDDAGGKGVADGSKDPAATMQSGTIDLEELTGSYFVVGTDCETTFTLQDLEVLALCTDCTEAYSMTIGAVVGEDGCDMQSTLEDAPFSLAHQPPDALMVDKSGTWIVAGTSEMADRIWTFSFGTK